MTIEIPICVLGPLPMVMVKNNAKTKIALEEAGHVSSLPLLHLILIIDPQSVFVVANIQPIVTVEDIRCSKLNDSDFWLTNKSRNIMF
jgi:hypothetical protein